MSNLEIKLARFEDSEIIFNIDSQCEDDCYSLQMIKDSLLNKNNINYLAVVDSKVAGYISYSMVCDEAELIKIVISENFRNNGYAKLLIKKSFELLKKYGIRNVFLEVRQTNIIAIKVYESLGFNKINIRKKYYDGCIDAIIYRLSI